MPAPSEIARSQDLQPNSVEAAKANDQALIDKLTKLVKSGAKPMSDADLYPSDGNVCLHVMEYGTDNDFGPHWFSGIPHRGDMIQTWVDEEQEVRGRVEEVEYVEADPQGGMGEIILYILPVS